MPRERQLLTEHYFLCFGALEKYRTKPPSLPLAGSWATALGYNVDRSRAVIVQLDVKRYQIKLLIKGEVKRMIRVKEVAGMIEAEADALKVHLSLIKPERIGLQLQTVHDADMFRRVLSSLMADTYEGIPGHWPRYVLKRGLLHRRGRCGMYRDCFAAVVAQKIFILHSKTSELPLQVLSLAKATAKFESAVRMVILQVCGEEHIFRGESSDDAKEWFEVLQKSCTDRYPLDAPDACECSEALLQQGSLPSSSDIAGNKMKDPSWGVTPLSVQHPAAAASDVADQSVLGNDAARQQYTATSWHSDMHKADESYMPVTTDANPGRLSHCQLVTHVAPCQEDMHPSLQQLQQAKGSQEPIVELALLAGAPSVRSESLWPRANHRDPTLAIIVDLLEAERTPDLDVRLAADVGGTLHDIRMVSPNLLVSVTNY